MLECRWLIAEWGCAWDTSKIYTTFLWNNTFLSNTFRVRVYVVWHNTLLFFLNLCAKPSMTHTENISYPWSVTGSCLLTDTRIRCEDADKCHANATCSSDGHCQCSNGLCGDGVNECRGQWRRCAQWGLPGIKATAAYLKIPYFDSLVQDCSISNANALEIL